MDLISMEHFLSVSCIWGTWTVWMLTEWDQKMRRIRTVENEKNHLPDRLTNSVDRFAHIQSGLSTFYLPYVRDIWLNITNDLSWHKFLITTILWCSFFYVFHFSLSKLSHFLVFYRRRKTYCHEESYDFALKQDLLIWKFGILYIWLWCTTYPILSAPASTMSENASFLHYRPRLLANPVW